MPPPPKKPSKVRKKPSKKKAFANVAQEKPDKIWQSFTDLPSDIKGLFISKSLCDTNLAETNKEFYDLFFEFFFGSFLFEQLFGDKELRERKQSETVIRPR